MRLPPKKMYSLRVLPEASVSARIVQLQSSPAAEPHAGNSGVIERGGELIESREEIAARRKQVVDCQVNDRGRLAQAVLRSERNILAENRWFVSGVPWTVNVKSG